MGGNFTTNYEKCIENKQTYALKKGIFTQSAERPTI